MVRERVGGGEVLLRPPRREDEAGYFELLRDPRVERWLRPPPQRFGDAEVRELLAEDIAHWEGAEFGLWALVEEGSGRLVGRAGLRRNVIAGEWRNELAWAVAPEWQGRGLATEAALAGLELAAELGLGEVVAIVLPGNRASRRVAEKAGMAVSGRVVHMGLLHVLYRG